MSRILKFRAWTRDGEWNDEGTKQDFVMIASDDLCFSEFEPISHLFKDTEDMFLVQFTNR